jgi:aspartate/methionine/tyrosine aminotransferase
VLRRAIAKKFLAFNRIEADPDRNIVVTCGATEGIIIAFLQEELETVLAFADAHDLLVFCDETYEYLVWPGCRHVSIASLPGGAARTVTVTSMGKTYSVTGWRVGYLVANESRNCARCTTFIP